MLRLVPSCALAMLLLAGTLFMAFPSGFTATSSSTTYASPGSALLASAETSLAKGTGPAQGHPLDCSLTGDLSAGCSGPASPHRSSSQGWSQICGYESCPVPARGGVGMTYDPETGYIVLFGGIVNLTLSANTTYNDTWIFSDGSWQQLHIPGPSARLGEYMCYDYADQYVLLFGGGPYLTLNNSLYDSDTWAFQNGTWTELHPTNSPSARGLGGMVWDPVDGYVLMYGGMSGETDIHSDTWIFQKGQWENLSLAAHPPPLLSPGMTYDPAEHYVLVYGGATPDSALEFGDDIEQTWAFSNGAWKNLTASIPGPLPPGRILSSMAYDPEDHVVLLFGGWNTTTSTLFGDTWIFADGVWSPFYVSPTPAVAIIGAALISTTSNAGLFLFGGVVGTFESYHGTNATWAYGTPPANTTVKPTPRPTPYDISVTVDPAKCAPVVFNGSRVAPDGNATAFAGAYNITAPHCSGYTFKSWFDNGGVIVSDTTAETTSLGLNGNGTLTAFYEPANTTAYTPRALEMGLAAGALVVLVGVGYWALVLAPRTRRPPT